jgi:D-3-phosphoglycerate dehydrogenase
MSDPRFRVGFMGRAMHQSFMDTAAKYPALEIVTLAIERPEAEIAEMLAGCHGYYARAARDELPRPWHVTPDFLGRFPKLLMVASYGAGYDTIDVDACTAAGVIVVNQAGGNAEGVAEHALGMMLGLLKRIPEAHAQLRAGTLGQRESLMGRELIGRTVGIVGLGHVGSRTAQLANAFGCRVLAVDPYLDAATCTARGAEKTEFARVLAESDIVTVHCPLTSETRGMFGAAQYALMKKGALFISTARGSIHDETALHAALVSGHLAGAGLDVWEKEPPTPAHPLLSHPAVMASPHTAGVTHESRERVARMAAEAFALAASGKVPPRLLNPAAAPRFAARWSETFGRAWPAE